MKRILLLFSVFLALSSLALSIAPASAGVPELNVKAICKTRDTDAKLFRSTTGQSVDECVHDEEAAKQQLNSLWTSTAASIRSRCESEAHSLGTTSYLDLVTCIQITDELKDDIKSVPKTSSEKR